MSSVLRILTLSALLVAAASPADAAIRGVLYAGLPYDSSAQIGARGEADPATDLSAHQSGGPSLSQAVAQVQRQYGGRVLDAKTERRGNREVHVIKVLTRDNKVKTVRVNGRSLK